MKRKMKEYIVTIISRKQKQEIQLKATNKKEAKEMVIDVITNTYLFKAPLLQMGGNCSFIYSV